MLITRADLAKLIRDNAHLLNAPAGIDPVRLLWALAGNESGFGSNAVPRHEDSYCANKGGIYASAIVRLTRMWGCWAHCSYGPWQVMFDNESDVTPWQAESDPQTAILEAIRFLNAYVFGARAPGRSGRLRTFTTMATFCPWRRNRRPTRPPWS